MDSDEETDNGGEPQPSTSRSRPMARGRRTILTPSPFHESDEDQSENVAAVGMSNGKKRNAKTPSSDNIPKKRSFTGEGTESGNKRKKIAVQYVEEESSSDCGTGGEESPIKERSKHSNRGKKSSPVSTPKKGNRKRQKVTNSNPVSQERIPAPPPSSAMSFGGGSQSLFSQIRRDSHPGIIKSLQLTNFMCHSNFQHNFHHNLNFITGQNGSGKSALLSGILIALGGKATVTSRTTSLKALIQKGKNTCRVAVTLLNKNGLRRYGDEITIERWVNSSGSGGYRIKSSGSEDPDCCFNWKPLKKPELDRILLGLNIQIDNPVAVLNQEVARSFLRSKDPKVKFNLFYDGTLLSKLESVIKETKEEIQETKVILIQQKQILKSLKKEIIHLQQKCEKIAELDEIKKKLTKVHEEYLWALVTEQEDMVKAIKLDIKRMTNEIEAVTKSVEKLKADYGNANEETVRHEQEEVRKQLNEKQRLVNKNRSELNEIKRNINQLRARLRVTVSTIQSKNRDIEKYTAQLEKRKADLEAKEKAETHQEAEKLNELQTEKKHLESIISSLQSDVENFRQGAEQKRENLQQIENEARSLKSQIEYKRRFISTLSNKDSNKYSVFGQKMEQLISKVKANLHRFRTPPKGPLGACFRVKDPKYAAVLEGVLWNHLDAFIVGDVKDLNLLREIVDSIYNERGGASQRRQTGFPGSRPPSIHYMKYAQQMYDIRRNHASIQNAPSILNLIEVEDDDHIVLNALIDIAEIEKQIVFKDNLSAATILKNEATVPKPLKFAYTLQWYKFTPIPHYAARVMKIRSRAEILKSGRNKEAEIEAVKAEIVTLEQQLRNMEPKKAEIKKEEQELTKLFNEKTNKMYQVKRRFGEISNDIKRHFQRIKEKEKTSDLSSFLEEIQDLRNDCEKEMAERDKVTRELEPLQPRVEELENERKILENDIQELNAKMNSFEEARDKLNARRIEIENGIKKAKNQLANLEAKKASRTEDLKNKEDERKEKFSRANKECPDRVTTKRSSVDTKKEYDAMQVRITETEARLGDGEELRATLAERKQKYRSMSDEVNPLCKMFKVIEQTNSDQEKSFNQMKTHMGRTLTFFFSSMAKQRGYEGRLMVDFETKELYYFVCPDGDASSKTLKAIDAQDKRPGPKTTQEIKQNKALKKALIEYSLGLSGGERSFATICFIMALWQVMECPFYMLDEFDVFMDAFNRKTSQLALMAHAKRFSQNQFVLFTPLDLGELPSPEDACVLRLMPPVRTGGGGGGAGSSGASQNQGDNVSPQGGSASTQGTSSKGGRGRAGDSPSDTAENVDPLSQASNSAGGKKGVRGTQRRKAALREV